MDYRATLNLPQTKFNMKANLSQKEPLYLKRWEKEDLYGQIQKAAEGKPLYVLHDGPPYANGHIHLFTYILMTHPFQNKEVKYHSIPWW